MERYYKDEDRRLADKMAREDGHVFTIEQIRDICELVSEHRWPDYTYSDDELHLWSLLIEYFKEE